jgi:hypothetical protein
MPYFGLKNVERSKYCGLMRLSIKQVSPLGE